MARRFARRRRRVAWLPVFGSGGTLYEERASGIQTNLTLTGDGLIRWDAVGLTFDYTDSAAFDQGTFSKTLADLTSGNEWLCKRIVGKYFAAIRPGIEGGIGGAPPVVDVAAGFIVVRTDDNGNPTTNFDEVNPLIQDSAEDPWVWRRRWFLRPYGGFDPTGPQATWGFQFPGSTAGYHSVADGPHIDQQTARRIHRQERLFFVQAARAYDPDGGTLSFVNPGTLSSFLDYRLLGTIAPRVGGNRGNASR